MFSVFSEIIASLCFELYLLICAIAPSKFPTVFIAIFSERNSVPNDSSVAGKSKSSG